MPDEVQFKDDRVHQYWLFNINKLIIMINVSGSNSLPLDFSVVPGVHNHNYTVK